METRHDIRLSCNPQTLEIIAEGTSNRFNPYTATALPENHLEIDGLWAKFKPNNSATIKTIERTKRGYKTVVFGSNATPDLLILL